MEYVAVITNRKLCMGFQ